MDDYMRLGQLFQEIKAMYINDRKREWEGSPFVDLIPTFGIKDIGNIGEQLFIRYATELGYEITPHVANNDYYDAIVYGKKLEIKFATLDKTGVFTANQVRDQPYDYLVLFALTPSEALYWVFPKAVAWSLGSWQHGSAEEKDTKMLSVRKTTRKNKYYPYFVGNSLDQVIERIQNAAI